MNKDKDNKSAGKTPSNPWVGAKSHWNDLMAANLSARSWLAAGFAAMTVLSVVLGAGLISQASKNKVVPFVVEIDKLGGTAYMGPAEPTNFSSDARIVKALLTDFITESRTVTPDVSVAKKNIFKLYAKLNSGDPAFAKMNEFMRSEDTSPFARAAKMMVNVELTSILSQDDKVYQVEWDEYERTRQGVLENRIHMKAIISIYTVDTSKFGEEQLRANPVGLYVQNFSWAKI